AIAKAWPKAQAHWSRFLLLGEPELAPRLPSVAQIHLGTRQVTLDPEAIEAHDLYGALEAILAHEVGHHVRYPGSLAVAARLRMLERGVLPLEEYSLINVFTDLLINEHLARRGLQDQLVAVYVA